VVYRNGIWPKMAYANMAKRTVTPRTVMVGPESWPAAPVEVALVALAVEELEVADAWVEDADLVAPVADEVVDAEAVESVVAVAEPDAEVEAPEVAVPDALLLLSLPVSKKSAG
jgi:hypothetical protein